MQAFYVFAAVLLAAVVAEAKSCECSRFGKEVHPIEWYDCTGMRDGNYVHPSECTRFISCSGNIASERDCADCPVDSMRCPKGRLVYNYTIDACTYADETRCEAGGDNPVTGNPGSTPPPGTPATGNPGSTPPPATPATGNPGSTPPSTSAATPGTPQVGDACDPKLCRNSGYCQSYLRCDTDTGKLVQESCGENLAWNPENPNGTDQVHGGNCDLWENLRPEVERRYRSDPECVACFWKATGVCSADYDYQPPNLLNRKVFRLTCAKGLVFSEAKKTCQRCQDVKRANGNACC